ncbi:helix-turn-helix transcriptional regulator [Moritella sp. F3]|uniref:helix-turn-helix domain-containing protein n=1 Tax=Moritella sp. F3 TaxID=2718882 RepID=UPI0018E0DB6C|nr:helix-turn-helix transcriptional regulator [Moritella sp. F3]GIC79341.1 hypothetical protein FMO001_40680 [Moritella sp. F1]GIC84060.1 hypothetical protein FMO003_43400 [Moritella sp. F3]
MKLDTNKPNFTESFTVVLEESGYTVTDIARLCGVSRTAINAYKTGAKPRKDMLDRLNEIFSGDVDEQELALQHPAEHITLKDATIDEMVEELKRRGVNRVNLLF